ncbi:MAG TPA: 4-alpha-glucanotransferase [Streptosporangiaceae bacterium]|nr:4-alpha-glucanotransferase [Streptosporangiaceae bacterium]
MTSEELRRRAEAQGVATRYKDWQGRQVEVSDETLAAILAALEAPLPGGPLPGAPAASHAGDLATAIAPEPRSRQWGFAVQLYSLRSRQSWGHGDLHDLADLATWSSRELGAGFVLINPLHAAEPVPPISPSPYLPMSRRYTSPLYLRIEDIPEYAELSGSDRARIDSLATQLRARNATSDLIDRDTVWRAKRTALEIIHGGSQSPRRRADFEAFRAREGRALQDWARWCALAEIHGPDWRSWPEQARRPGERSRDGLADGLAAQEEFHAWVQWVVDAQLTAAQDAARAAGMETGIIKDLAVGVHPGGADAWAWQDVLVRGMSAGAPPDEFNQRGQDWTQPPWHPQRLAAHGYAPLADLIAAGLRHAGGLRVDHVMGLLRLWWVPAGMTPDRGAYVRYDHEAMVGVLASEARAARALAVGEDLGTVADWIREYLASRGILGTSMLWFERGPDGKPLPPGSWRRNCLAMVGTHDVPPVAAFVTGEQVELRARLGLLTRPYDAERNDAQAAVSAWRDALVAEGLLPAGSRPDPAEFSVALHGYLARTPAMLIGVSLADAVGDRRPQNMPGTTNEYPNWRVPLCDGEGRAVLLEDLADSAHVRSVALAAARPR